MHDHPLWLQTEIPSKKHRSGLRAAARGRGAGRGTGGGEKQSVNAWFPSVVGEYQIVNQSVVKYPSS